MKFARLGFGLVFALSLVTGMRTLAFPQANPTPPPPPRPNPGATAGTTTGTPTPATTPAGALPSTQPTLQPTPTGKGGKKAKPSPEPSPSDTPEPPQFASLDGVWEVQLQPLDGTRTVYQHLTVKQDGANLRGTWDRSSQDKVPYTGTFDGRIFKLTVATKPKETIFTGYAENFGDMVGLINDGGQVGTPFTASHRKKEKIGQ